MQTRRLHAACRITHAAEAALQENNRHAIIQASRLPGRLLRIAANGRHGAEDKMHINTERYLRLWEMLSCGCPFQQPERDKVMR